jgi:fucose permease
MVQNTPFYKRASFTAAVVGLALACVGLFLSVEAVLTHYDSSTSVYSGFLMGMGLGFFTTAGGFRHLEKELESKQGN